MRYMLLIYLIGSVSFADTTYIKDAKPIFEIRCASCHNTGNIGKNWLDYNDAKKNSKQIKDRVVIKKDMPIANATNMTQAERDIIKKWVDEGAKK